jgi:hypothetical protein
LTTQFIKGVSGNEMNRYLSQGVSMEFMNDESINITDILRPILKIQGCDIDNATLKKMFYIIGDDADGKPYSINATEETANWVDLIFIWDVPKPISDPSVSGHAD